MQQFDKKIVKGHYFFCGARSKSGAQKPVGHRQYFMLNCFADLHPGQRLPLPTPSQPFKRVCYERDYISDWPGQKQ